jgi:hypothetical protein
MLSLQKCEADAKDPVVTRQTHERTQHLCNAWQVFGRDSTATHRVGLGSQGMLGSPLLRTVLPLWEGPSVGFKCPVIREHRILGDAS